jgi:hypothetical protein
MWGRIAVVVVVFAAGVLAGWAVFDGPLTGANKAEAELRAHQEKRGHEVMTVSCHKRSDVTDYSCESWEAVGPSSNGFQTFIVRHRGDRWVFDGGAG